MATNPPWLSDWVTDPQTGTLINKLTGEVIHMPTTIRHNANAAINTANTGGWNTTTTTATSPTIGSNWDKVFIDTIIKQQDEIEQYRALRMYLAANHESILAGFDALYNARKRMEVKV